METWLKRLYAVQCLGVSPVVALSADDAQLDALMAKAAEASVEHTAAQQRASGVAVDAASPAATLAALQSVIDTAKAVPAPEKKP